MAFAFLTFAEMCSSNFKLDSRSPRGLSLQRRVLAHARRCYIGGCIGYCQIFLKLGRDTYPDEIVITTCLTNAGVNQSPIVAQNASSFEVISRNTLVSFANRNESEFIASGRSLM